VSIHDEAAWEERYREAVWSGEPNRQLVDEATALPAGTALDAGCGEGGDALWLAGQGWQVTAVDFSTTALVRGRTRACELGLDGRIDFQHADLRTWTPPAGRFDLVTAHYLHLPSEVRGPLFERLAAAVAPGGTLLVVGHLLTDADGHGHDHGEGHGYEPPPGEEHSGAAHDPDMMFTAEDVAASLDPAEWSGVVTGTRERSAAAVARTGNPAPDTVLVARRRSGAR
jgi:SAM-dependent methyltransferase